MIDATRRAGPPSMAKRTRGHLNKPNVRRDSPVFEASTSQPLEVDVDLLRSFVLGERLIVYAGSLDDRLSEVTISLDGNSRTATIGETRRTGVNGVFRIFELPSVRGSRLSISVRGAQPTRLEVRVHTTAYRGPRG